MHFYYMYTSICYITLCISNVYQYVHYIYAC